VKNELATHSIPQSIIVELTFVILNYNSSINKLLLLCYVSDMIKALFSLTFMKFWKVPKWLWEVGILRYLIKHENIIGVRGGLKRYSVQRHFHQYFSYIVLVSDWIYEIW